MSVRCVVSRLDNAPIVTSMFAQFIFVNGRTVASTALKALARKEICMCLSIQQLDKLPSGSHFMPEIFDLELKFSNLWSVSFPQNVF